MRYNFSEFPFLGKLFLLGSLIAVSTLTQPFRASQTPKISHKTPGKYTRNDSISTVPVPQPLPRFENDYAEKVNWEEKK